ncbi:hypothetical protein [Oceanimonas smirnovii]|uniref:hypothetical protein n=1 Tax=Oceanimonas smirnovii TaxID=264574 RepID=UPI003FCF2C47
MSWSRTSLTWPASAEDIASKADAVLSRVATTQQQAMATLSQAAGAVSFRPHALSDDAAQLAHLRALIEQMLVTGHRITVTPYDYGVGQVESSGSYLAPGNAASRLAEKLQGDAAPPGSHVQGLLVTANSLAEFADALSSLTAVLPIPELCACARRSRAESTNAQDRMQAPTGSATPKWVPGRHLFEPLRSTVAILGSSVAQLESLAADTRSPINKLQALASKRAAWLEQQKQALNALKTGLNGSLYAMNGSGSASGIAASLSAGLPSYERAHTAAVLLVSEQPMTFFKELLP